MSTDTWKLEKDLCRCCHAEGSFYDLSEPRCNLGQTEVYSKMLKHCFDLEVTPVTGVLSALTFTICESCVLRLRDASNFKRQVQSCEERFKNMYKNAVQVMISEGVEVKEEAPVIEELKQEKMDDDEDFCDVPVNDDDEEDNKTVYELKVEDAKKAKAKPKPKPKSKPRPKKPPPKKAGRPRKSPEPPKEGDEKDAEETNSKRPRDKQLAEYYVINNDLYQCKQCDKNFSSQPLISQHYRFVHLKRRPRERKCAHCDARVPGYLRAYHLEEMHGIPAPTCGVCQKKFRYPCHVLQHQKKVHMGEKTAVCRICDKSFFNNLSLKLHMSTHSNEKKYKCGVCQREFRWENNLKDHVKIHTGDKRYVCKICGKAFVQKSTLKQHSMRNHPGVDV